MSRPFRIIIFSDSHGKTDRMHEIIDKEKCDTVLHLGDCYDDMEELRMCYDFPIHGVMGNVDYGEGISVLQMNIEGAHIFMCHGHQFRVKSHLDLIRKHGIALGAEVILFGHTHEAYIEEGKILMMNPGSITLPRHQEQPSYGVLEIVDGKVKHEIIYI